MENIFLPIQEKLLVVSSELVSMVFIFYGMKILKFKNNKSLQTSLLKGRLSPLPLEEGENKKA